MTFQLTVLHCSYCHQEKTFLFLHILAMYIKNCLLIHDNAILNDLTNQFLYNLSSNFSSGGCSEFPFLTRRIKITCICNKTSSLCLRTVYTNTMILATKHGVPFYTLPLLELNMQNFEFEIKKFLYTNIKQILYSQNLHTHTRTRTQIYIIMLIQWLS